MTLSGSTAINDSQEAGFSLVEMLVVLAILAFASVMILPSFRTTGEKTPEQLARAFQAMTIQARTNAISNGTTEQVLVDPPARKIVYAGADPIEIPSSFDLELRVARELINADESVALLLFPDGGSTGLEITFKSGKRPKAWVSVSWLTGIPTLLETTFDA